MMPARAINDPTESLFSGLSDTGVHFTRVGSQVQSLYRPPSVFKHLAEFRYAGAMVHLNQGCGAFVLCSV